MNANSLYTTTGLIATTPRYIKTTDGLDIVSFRLASGTKKFDRTKMDWVDAETNWFTITAFGNLALNATSSLGKGDRVVVSGTLRVRDWDNGERSGTSVEIEAETIGHDLVWGTSTYTRTTHGSSVVEPPKPNPTKIEEPQIV